MSFWHSKVSHFALEDAGGTSRTLNDYIDSLAFSPEIETADTTGLGDTAREFIPGLANARISISGHWDDTATSGLDVCLGGLYAAGGVKSDGTLPAWIYGPVGSTGTYVKYTGSCIVTSYAITSRAGEKVSFTAELQVSGDVTRTTF